MLGASIDILYYIPSIDYLWCKYTFCLTIIYGELGPYPAGLSPSLMSDGCTRNCAPLGTNIGGHNARHCAYYRCGTSSYKLYKLKVWA